MITQTRFILLLSSPVTHLSFKVLVSSSYTTSLKFLSIIARNYFYLSTPLVLKKSNINIYTNIIVVSNFIKNVRLKIGRSILFFTTLFLLVNLTYF